MRKFVLEEFQFLKLLGKGSFGKVGVAGEGKGRGQRCEVEEGGDRARRSNVHHRAKDITWNLAFAA